MQICRVLAGYSYAQADLVRRAMSKKKEEEMIKESGRFIEGCMKNGIDESLAGEIFDEMVGFAKYAFNKSHATAYGIISYRTAYLKAHYPGEYFSALLTSVLDNTQKLREYIADATKFNLSVLPPDINESDADFTVSGDNIRYGLLAIKNVSRQLVNSIIAERKNGKFKSFDEFVSRIPSSNINKRTFEFFIKCGVFDCFKVTRRALMRCYEQIIDSELEKKRNNIYGQMDLFSIGSGAEKTSGGYEYPDVEEYSLKELLLLEKESSGMYFSGHMIDNFKNHIEKLNVTKISDITDDYSEENISHTHNFTDKQTVKVAGIITDKTTKNTKNGDTMAFIKIEDRYSEIEVIVFSRQYAKFSEFLSVDNGVMIEGNLSVEDSEMPRILLSDMIPLDGNATYNPDDEKTKEEALSNNKNESKTDKKIYIKIQNMDEKAVDYIKRVSIIYPGNSDVILYISSSKKYLGLKNCKADCSDKAIAKLKSYFGDDCIALR